MIWLLFVLPLGGAFFVALDLFIKWCVRWQGSHKTAKLFEYRKRTGLTVYPRHVR